MDALDYILVIGITNKKDSIAKALLNRLELQIQMAGKWYLLM